MVVGSHQQSFKTIKIYDKTNLNKSHKPGHVPSLTMPMVVNVVGEWREKVKIKVGIFVGIVEIITECNFKPRWPRGLFVRIFRPTHPLTFGLCVWSKTDHGKDHNRAHDSGRANLPTRHRSLTTAAMTTTTITTITTIIIISQ
jgi:hypothetical protein